MKFCSLWKSFRNTWKSPNSSTWATDVSLACGYGLVHFLLLIPHLRICQSTLVSGNQNTRECHQKKRQVKSRKSCVPKGTSCSGLSLLYQNLVSTSGLNGLKEVVETHKPGVYLRSHLQEFGSKRRPQQLTSGAILGEVLKPRPARAQQPQRHHMEDPSPITVSQLASRVPRTQHHLPLASALAVGVHKDHRELMRFLLGAVPQFSSLSNSCLSCPRAISGPNQNQRLISFFSWSCATSKTFSVTWAHDKIQEGLSYIAPNALVWKDLTCWQKEAGSLCFIKSNANSLLLTWITTNLEITSETRRPLGFPGSCVHVTNDNQGTMAWALKTKGRLEWLLNPQLLSHGTVSRARLDQPCSQTGWNQLCLFMESPASAWVSETSSSSRPQFIKYHEVHIKLLLHFQAEEHPDLSQTQILFLCVNQFQFLTQNMPPSLPQGQTQAQIPCSLPNLPPFSLSQIRSCKITVPTLEMKVQSFIPMETKYLEWPCQKPLKQRVVLPFVRKKAQKEHFSQPIFSISLGSQASQTLTSAATFPECSENQVQERQAPSQPSAHACEGSNAAQEPKTWCSDNLLKKSSRTSHLKDTINALQQEPKDKLWSLEITFQTVQEDDGKYSENDFKGPEKGDSGSNFSRALDKKLLGKCPQKHPGKKSGQLHEGVDLTYMERFLDPKPFLKTRIRRSPRRYRGGLQLQAPQPTEVHTGEALASASPPPAFTSLASQGPGAKDTDKAGAILEEPPQKAAGQERSHRHVTPCSVISRPCQLPVRTSTGPAASPVCHARRLSKALPAAQWGGALLLLHRRRRGRRRRLPPPPPLLPPLTNGLLDRIQQGITVLRIRRDRLGPQRARHETQKHSRAVPSGEACHGKETREAQVGSRVPLLKKFGRTKKEKHCRKPTAEEQEERDEEEKLSHASEPSPPAQVSETHPAGRKLPEKQDPPASNWKRMTAFLQFLSPRKKTAGGHCKKVGFHQLLTWKKEQGQARCAQTAAWVGTGQVQDRACDDGVAMNAICQSPWDTSKGKCLCHQESISGSDQMRGMEELACDHQATTPGDHSHPVGNRDHSQGLLPEEPAPAPGHCQCRPEGVGDLCCHHCHRFHLCHHIARNGPSANQLSFSLLRMWEKVPYRKLKE